MMNDDRDAIRFHHFFHALCWWFGIVLSFDSPLFREVPVQVPGWLTRQVFTGPLIGPLGPLAHASTLSYHLCCWGYRLSFIIIIVIIIIIFMFKSLGCTFDLLHHLLHTGAKQSWRATAGIRRLLQAVNPYEHHMILHFESFWYILLSDYFWLRMLDI